MGRQFAFDDRAFVARPILTEGRWVSSLRRIPVLAFALGMGFVVYLLLPHATNCGESMLRAQCINNLKQIQLALASYHERYGTLPPRYVTDATARPLHSWRVLILPFLDQQRLYDQYLLSEPWDGPNNIKLLDKMPGLFACPTNRQQGKSRTNYLVIAGPGTMFPSTTPVKFAEVSDGLASTLSVVETTSFDVPWTSPIDLDVSSMDLGINDPVRPGISSGHGGGAKVVLANGSVRFFKDALSAKRLRTFTTASASDWNPDDDGAQSF